MTDVTMRELLEAGVHFGHQTERWNPKMAPYIYNQINGIHIIDLRITVERLAQAAQAVQESVSQNQVVLFVGTKKQAQKVLGERAREAGMPFVNYRWLGGMLTNFPTIQKRVFYMKELERMEQSREMENLPKKERLRLRRELSKLRQNLGGVRDLNKRPDMVFIVDVLNQHTAVREAQRLKIPIVALVDTNSNPDPIDYLIPGNDDAIRSIDLVVSAITQACIQGRKRADQLRAEARSAAEEAERKAAKAAADRAAKAAQEEEVEQEAESSDDEAVEDGTQETEPQEAVTEFAETRIDTTPGFTSSESVASFSPDPEPTPSRGRRRSSASSSSSRPQTLRASTSSVDQGKGPTTTETAEQASATEALEPAKPTEKEKGRDA